MKKTLLLTVLVLASLLTIGCDDIPYNYQYAVNNTSGITQTINIEYSDITTDESVFVDVTLAPEEVWTSEVMSNTSYPFPMRIVCTGEVEDTYLTSEIRSLKRGTSYSLTAGIHFLLVFKDMKFITIQL